MEKIKILVIVNYIEVDGVYNNEIYYHNSSWTDLGLAICTGCGELFAFSNILKRDKKNISIKELVKSKYCPKCGHELSESIEEYPHTFVTSSGKISHLSQNAFGHIDIKMEKYLEIWKIS